MIYSKNPPQLNLEDGFIENNPSSSIRQSSEVETVVGSTVHVEGDFASQGDIIVKGKVTGTVETSQKLIVEIGARVIANVKAKQAHIAGEVVGNIIVEELVELSGSAKVVGDIETKKLSIEPGALFKGMVHMPGIEKKDK